MGRAGKQTLFSYPEHIRVARPVPKKRIIAAAKPGRQVQELLTRQVEKITWQYKLAPETLKLPATRAVPEIQVFTLTLKPEGLRDDLPEAVLRCIDGAIGFPILFELVASREQVAARDRVRLVASYKRPSESQTGKWVCGDYFFTDWLPADIERAALPVALNLGVLYEQLLQPLIPLPRRPGESLVALVERVGHIRTKEREIARTQARLDKERQFNRKVEINAELRHLTKELERMRGASNG